MPTAARAVALLALLGLAAALAGCSGRDADASSSSTLPDGTTAGPGGATGPSLPAPTHKVGDGWQWESPQLGTYTYAIRGEQGDDFVVGTDNAGVAYFDARTDISTLGLMRKSDLAGSQQVDGQLQRVEFFQFPLTLNKTWTTTWDGAPVTVRVTALTAEKADLVARRPDGTTYSSYTYVAKNGYFGRLAFHDENGTEGFASTVSKALTGYKGPFRSWHLQQVVDYGGAFGQTASGTFQVPTNVTDVYIEARFSCTTGNVVAAIGPPTGPAEDRGYANTDACPQQTVDSGVLSPAPAQEENWGALVTATPGTQGDFTVQVFLRTLVEETVA